MPAKKLNMLLVLLTSISLSGCVTTTNIQDKTQIRTLEKRISFLENQLHSKDSEITNLTNTLEKEQQEKADLLKVLSEKKQVIENTTKITQKSKGKRKIYHSSIIGVQTALRNAGFDLGLIDGIMGKRTRAALKEFQKSNGLPVSGQIDKQTWALLREYLNLKE